MLRIRLGTDSGSMPIGVWIAKVSTNRIFVIDDAGHRFRMYDRRGRQLVALPTRRQASVGLATPTDVALDGDTVFVLNM